MDSISEYFRRITIFLFATLLWLHALFLWNWNSKFISTSGRLLHLTASELVLLGLLVVFSFAAGSSFWRRCKSIAYIYFFPFVLLLYFFYALYRLLRLIHAWLATNSSTVLDGVRVADSEPTVEATSLSADIQVAPKRNYFAELGEFLLRPFRGFFFLWCLLLIFTTHKFILWLSFAIVVIHLIRRIYQVFMWCFFSGPFLAKIGQGLLKVLDQPLASLAAFATGKASQSQEMKNLKRQLELWENILTFLKNSPLMTRWAWFLAIVFVGCVHLYFSVLFSFVYYGIGRITAIALSWFESLVSSIFIPLAYSDLPRTLPIRIASYVHATLVVFIGIGTIVNFLQRRLQSVRKAADELSQRLAQPEVLANLQVLEVKINPPATMSGTTSPEPQS